MKILLVLPAAEKVRVTAERPDVPRRAMLRFSVLPLTMVAAWTPPEHEVRLVDENVEPLDLEAAVDLVGISFMTAVAPRAYEIARHFQSRGIPVVGGGYHPTLMPEETVRYLDAVVVGPAEGAWPQVLKDLAAGQLRKFYRGSDPGGCSYSAPIPRRDLLECTGKYYATIHAVQTARGCNHSCRYCSIAAFHGRYCYRPVAEVIEELRTIPRDFLIVDDNIVAHRERALELFRAMKPLGKRWVAQSSLEVADDAGLLLAMREAGCRGLFVGLESLNQQDLAGMGKEFNNTTRYRERLRTLRRAGIGVVGSMIVGLDGDGPGVFERWLTFLQHNAIDVAQVNILTPLPGTRLFEEMDRAGRITDRDWSHYDFRHVVMRPARMTTEELQAGADWLYAQFYRLDRVLIRFFRTLWTCGVAPAVLSLRLGLTYRYDNRREGIRGWNPAYNESAHANRTVPRPARAAPCGSDASLVGCRYGK